MHRVRGNVLLSHEAYYVSAWTRHMVRQARVIRAIERKLGRIVARERREHMAKVNHAV